jgi:hypothetical protein
MHFAQKCICNDGPFAAPDQDMAWSRLADRKCVTSSEGVAGSSDDVRPGGGGILQDIRVRRIEHSVIARAD